MQRWIACTSYITQYPKTTDMCHHNTASKSQPAILSAKKMNIITSYNKNRNNLNTLSFFSLGLYSAADSTHNHAQLRLKSATICLTTGACLTVCDQQLSVPGERCVVFVRNELCVHAVFTNTLPASSHQVPHRHNTEEKRLRKKVN